MPPLHIVGGGIMTIKALNGEKADINIPLL